MGRARKSKQRWPPSECMAVAIVAQPFRLFSALRGMSGAGPPPPTWQPIQEAAPAPPAPPPPPAPVRFCGWCAGRLAQGESLALALNGELWEVCELCYLLSLARQHAWRAHLSPGERATLLEQTRHLTALLAAFAGLADELVRDAAQG